MNNVKELIGQTLKEIKKIRNNYENEEIIFITKEDKKYKLYHEQDCCESVKIKDINGNLEDLVGNPILQSIESSSENDNDGEGTSTWTFYRFATVKGYVIISFYGTSNGFYSEKVSFEEIKDECNK